jgi:hypothetical protein
VKTAAERSIEALTWAAVVIWLGFALVAHILNYVWLVVMMLGIILLSSAIYQRSRGWQTSLSLWIFGIWMAVFSVLETVSTIVAAVSGGDGLGIDLWVYLGIALVSMGVAVVFRTVQGPHLATGSRTPSRRQGDTGSYTTERSRYIPRRVQDDYSTGYIPSPQEQAQYDSYERPSRGRRASSDRGDDDQYTQSSRRGQRADYQPQDPDWSSTPPPAPERSRTPSRQRRRSRPAAEPNDLESRVDDIIRRSRERRGGEQTPSDDLPY